MDLVSTGRAISGPQYVEEFMPSPREYAILNSGDEEVVIAYGGEVKRIPPKDEIVKPDPRYKDVFHSAQDAEGNWIPGTLVLRDLYSTDPVMGGERIVWSAANCIKQILGIDPKTGVASSAYAMRGLSLLPKSPTKAQLNKIYTEGRERYEQWRLKDARDAVAAHDEANALRRKLSMPEIPGGPEYLRAVVFIQESTERERERVKAILRKEDKKPVVEPQVDDTKEAVLNKLVAEAAKKYGSDPKEVKEQLLKDPEVVKLLKG